MTTLQRTGAGRSVARDLLAKVSMAIISPLLLIGLLEAAAFVWERGQANGPYAWELVASRRMEWEQYPAPGAGYTLMKPGSHYEWQGITVDINAHGLRGPETTYDKPPQTVRVLNLGDSVAMGWGVEEEATYGRQLEGLLNAQHTDDPRYEVINAGVPGWNLANAAAYLQAEGLKFEPDLILLDVTIANDINGGSALLADKQPPAIKWLRANTHFWPFLTIQMRWLQARGEGRERIEVIDPPKNAAMYFPLDPEANRWDEIWAWVSDIERLGSESEAEVVLMLFPLEFQVTDERYATTAQSVLTAKAAEAGLRVVDLLPVFRQACQEKPDGPCRLEDRYLFADVWMHPSAHGHQLTAEALLDVLADIP